MALADPRNFISRPTTSSEVAVGPASTQSTAFSAQCTAVRLSSTTACRVTFGPNPIATATSFLLLPRCGETFMVRPGDRLAVIQDAAPGKLSFTEMAS